MLAAYFSVYFFNIFFIINQKILINLTSPYHDFIVFNKYNQYIIEKIKENIKKNILLMLVFKLFS